MKKTYAEIKDAYANDKNRTRRGTKKPMSVKRAANRRKSKLVKLSRKINRNK